LKSIGIRVVLYILLAVGIAQVLTFEAVHFSKEVMFGEFGFVQLLQSIFLLTSVILLWALSRRNGTYRELFICFALVFAVLLIRENDQIFEMLLMHGFWKWPALLVILFLGWYFIRNRRTVLEQLEDFSCSLPFGVVIAAMCTLVFSRLFGGSSFWKVVMMDNFDHIAKAAAEEGTELFALGLILAFSIECFFLGVGAKRKTS